MAWRAGFPKRFRFLDDEHEEIVHGLERLKTGSDKESAKSPETLAQQILNDLRTHMAHEEEIMAQYNYPEIDLHKKHHGALSYSFETILGFFDVDALFEHRDLVVTHIENKLSEEMFADRLLAEFLRQNQNLA